MIIYVYVLTTTTERSTSEQSDGFEQIGVTYREKKTTSK